MGKCCVVPGCNEPGVAERLAVLLGCSIARVYRKRFPDGELYVRVEDGIGRDSTVLIVNTMYPRQDHSFVETLLLVDAVARMGAGKIIAIIPYIAYSRQDKVFMKGEPVSIEVLLRSLSVAGATHLVTVDIHNPSSLEHFSGWRYNLLVSDLLVEKSLEYLENPVVIAPDKGALERALHAARTLGLEYDYLVKKRDRVSGEVSLEPKEISVNGRDVVIVDDIISTGGTIALAAKKCLDSGAKRVVVAATHSLLISNALKKIVDAGVYKLITTNSIPLIARNDFIQVVDLSERIADTIKSIT